MSYPALFFATFFALSLGLVLIQKPLLMIRFQQRFYKKINWRIEPVSLSKEIRNTRAMGVFLIIFSLVTVAIVFFQ